MAWEQRDNCNRRYYYRGTRDANGRVQKTYLGSGPEAAAAAAEDEATRANEARQAALHKDLLDRLHATADHLRAQHDVHDLIMEAALLAAGFHNHRGQWRKRSHGRLHRNTFES